MLSNIWDIVLYKPLLNALAFLVSVVPGGNIGLAIIILTLVVKAILFPFSQRAIESQAQVKELEPELAKIKASGKSKEERARLTMELYKERKMNPFSGCLLTLIQIPIIFALYYVFWKGIIFDASVLYDFIPVPESINMSFLGIENIGGKSIVLAILAGASQFFQAHFMPTSPPKIATNTPGGASFQESMAKSMGVQMKYVFPLIVIYVSYTISGAVALYWITSNIFTIGQQLYAEKAKKKKKDKK